LSKELKAAKDGAVRARLRGAALYEDNINQKKENKEGAREETRGSARGCAHFAAEYTDVKPPRAHCAVATGAGPSFRAFDEVPDDAFQIIEQRSLLKCILTQKC
jgi:hypothetical protein